MASNEPFGSASSPSPRQPGAPRTSEGNDRARTAENDLLRRVPPHSPEAEQAVLGGILMDAPIRTLGDHPVRVRLHASIVATVPVKVVSDHPVVEEEAQPEAEAEAPAAEAE